MSVAAGPAIEHSLADDLDVHHQNSGRFSQEISYEVDLRIVVMPPEKTKRLRVWVPLPQSDNLQTVSGSHLSVFPQAVKPQIGVEKIHRNKFAYFEFSSPAGAQVIRHRFTAKLAQVNWGLDLAKIRAADKWPDSFAPYLENRFDDSTGQQFDSVLSRIVPEKDGTAIDVRKIIRWTEDNLTYDHKRASLKADALHALNERAGHCSDFHGLCSTFGRQIGFPSRVSYGLAMFNKSSPSHCKLEVFFPQHGWVPFDVSETQKLLTLIGKSNLSADKKAGLAAAAQERLFSGFRDNTWLQVTRGTDYELVPPATNGRVPLVRIVHVEADGVTLPDNDPALSKKLHWLTSYRVVPARRVSYPYEDFRTLK